MGLFTAIFATLLGGLLSTGASLGIQAATRKKPEEVEPLKEFDPERERLLRRQRSGSAGFMSTILTSSQGVSDKTKLGQ